MIILHDFSARGTLYFVHFQPLSTFKSRVYNTPCYWTNIDKISTFQPELYLPCVRDIATGAPEYETKETVKRRSRN